MIRTLEQVSIVRYYFVERVWRSFYDVADFSHWKKYAGTRFSTSKSFFDVAIDRWPMIQFN